MLKERLKELRLQKGITQEAVAKELGVSTQTVSKWERGLVSPDISLLPMIARFYGCTMDALFEIDGNWDHLRVEEFYQKIRQLASLGEHQKVYQTFLEEIGKRPDQFRLYTNVMHYLDRHDMLEKEYLQRMIYLADYTLRHCAEDDIRNDVIKKITILCARSDCPEIKGRAKFYYNKIPSIRNSREIYAKLVFGQDEALRQIKKNIIYTLQLSEGAIRQLIRDDMLPEEKLFYYRKAATLYETVLDGKFGGFWDPPLLNDYFQIARLLLRMEKTAEAEIYIKRCLTLLERHLTPEKCRAISDLIEDVTPAGATPYQKLCKSTMIRMANDPYFAPFHDTLICFLQRYCDHFGLAFSLSI